MRPPNRLHALTLTAAALTAGAYVLLRPRPEANPPDNAPGRAARRARFGRHIVAGRTVTIAKPRSEVYALVRDFTNLPRFMENVRSIEAMGEGRTAWRLAGPAGGEVRLVMRLVTDRPDEAIAWRAEEGSEIDAEGKVMFRDAPGGRGTEVEAIIAYRPPAGLAGHWVAKVFRRDPALQGRHELKRLKMLMETGEIATAANRKEA